MQFDIFWVKSILGAVQIKLSKFIEGIVICPFIIQYNREREYKYYHYMPYPSVSRSTEEKEPELLTNLLGFSLHTTKQLGQRQYY